MAGILALRMLVVKSAIKTIDLFLFVQKHTSISNLVSSPKKHKPEIFLCMLRLYLSRESMKSQRRWRSSARQMPERGGRSSSQHVLRQGRAVEAEGRMRIQRKGEVRETLAGFP